MESLRIYNNNDHTCLFHHINICRVSLSEAVSRQMLMHRNMNDPYILSPDWKRLTCNPNVTNGPYHHYLLDEPQFHF